VSAGNQRFGQGDMEIRVAIRDGFDMDRLIGRHLRW
jgi:hypothetical protein